MINIDRYLFELKCFGVVIHIEEGTCEYKTIISIINSLWDLCEEYCGDFRKVLAYYYMKFNKLLIDRYEGKKYFNLKEAYDLKLKTFKKENNIDYFDEDISFYIENNNLNLESLYILSECLKENVQNFTERDLEMMNFTSSQEILDYCKKNNINSTLEFAYKFL